MYATDDNIDEVLREAVTRGKQDFKGFVERTLEPPPASAALNSDDLVAALQRSLEPKDAG